MKIFNFVFVSVLLLITLGCESTTGPNIDEETIEVTIDNAEVYNYQTGIAGDEELATIVRQPDHYQTSTIVRDSATQWEAVYRYKPESNFKGTDWVELRLGTGSDGESPHTNYRLIKIGITVQ